jgi:hypothetical protein
VSASPCPWADQGLVRRPSATVANDVSGICQVADGREDDRALDELRLRLVTEQLPSTQAGHDICDCEHHDDSPHNQRLRVPSPPLKLLGHDAPLPVSLRAFHHWPPITAPLEVSAVISLQHVWPADHDRSTALGRSCVNEELHRGGHLADAAMRRIPWSDPFASRPGHPEKKTPYAVRVLGHRPSRRRTAVGATRAARATGARFGA